MHLKVHKTDPILWLAFNAMDLATNAHRVHEWLHAIQLDRSLIEKEYITNVNWQNGNVIITFKNMDVLKDWVLDRWIFPHDPTK